jgi:hypothetical protein
MKNFLHGNAFPKREIINKYFYKQEKKISPLIADI